MKAIILAAGKGTRLRPWTSDTPKPLLELGGRPILNYILDGFAAAGVDDVSLVIGYLGDQIIDYYGETYSGMRMRYHWQEKQLGTGHALLLAEEILNKGDFMLSFGDVLMRNENYPALRRFHERGGFEISVTLNPVLDPYAGAAVYMKGPRVEALIEKPPRGESRTFWNHRGLFVLGPSVFDELKSLEKSPRGEYELPVAVNNMIQRGVPTGAMAVSGHTSDIGTQEEFRQYESYLAESAAGE